MPDGRVRGQSRPAGAVHRLLGGGARGVAEAPGVDPSESGAAGSTSPRARAAQWYMRCIEGSCRQLAKVPARVCSYHLSNAWAAYHSASGIRTRARARYHYRKVSGLCVKCGRHAADSGVKCHSCQTKARCNARKHYKQRYHVRKNSGMCIRHGCQRKARPNDVRCLICVVKERVNSAKPLHNEKRRRRTAQRRADGVCTSCGNRHTDKYLRCKLCRMKFREYQTRRAKQRKDDIQ